jgi:DNA polymerase-3 subunit delta'
VEAEAELLPTKDARRLKREGETAAKRAQRRARAETLDHGLQLAGLWLRDVACVADGVPELVHHSDRAEEVAADARDVRSSGAAREAVGLVEEARTTLILNPSEELVLEALASRIERTLHG